MACSEVTLSGEVTLSREAGCDNSAVLAITGTADETISKSGSTTERSAVGRLICPLVGGITEAESPALDATGAASSIVPELGSSGMRQNTITASTSSISPPAASQ